MDTENKSHTSTSICLRRLNSSCRSIVRKFYKNTSLYSYDLSFFLKRLQLYYLIDFVHVIINLLDGFTRIGTYSGEIN